MELPFAMLGLLSSRERLKQEARGAIFLVLVWGWFWLAPVSPVPRWIQFQFAWLRPYRLFVENMKRLKPFKNVRKRFISRSRAQNRIIRG